MLVEPMTVKILAVTHFEHKMPDDPAYLPVMAGSALAGSVPSGYQRDDAGDNISARNRTYSELTALYWAWKNLDADIIGLCHYRRFFASLSASEAELLLDEVDILLPEERRYYIETNYSQYIHSHHRQDLDIAREIAAEKYPEYISAWDARMKMTHGHRFNMFVMRKDLLEEYCTWLFDILFELEKRLDTEGYTGLDSRVYGLVAERLLDIWIDHNGYRTMDIPYVMGGRENLFLKAIRMTGRKLVAPLRRK